MEKLGSPSLQSHYETSEPIQIADDLPPFWIIVDKTTKRARAVFESTQEMYAFCVFDEQFFEEGCATFDGFMPTSFGEHQEMNAFDLGYLQ